MVRDTQSLSVDQVQIDEIEELLNLYIALFHDREPLTKYIGFSKERMLSIARCIYGDSNSNPLSRGLCWMARDRAEANRGVGFIVCNELTAEESFRMPDNLTDQELEKLSALMSLLEEVRSPVKDRISLGAGKCLYVSAIGVSPGYEGKGIAKRLLQTALSEAESRGFLYAFSECTSPASRKLHEKFGFESLKSVSVSMFTVNGKYPFKGCNLDVHLMWKIFDRRKTG